ncbi:MAG: hypothetical protein DRP42_03035 [Tenericutes bacterium]|nr:MAG: hypothetical protein DRP42_03035 [Mycoplasmatota bacterium]
MSLLTATQLADAFNVSKGAVSQWFSSGKLDGCYDGDGRGRRYDLQKCADAMGKKIDAGQGMGNAAKTRKVAKALKEKTGVAPKESSRLPDNDPSRYEMARTLKAEEEARTLRRRNAEAEGQYVLTSEVSRNVAKLIGQEVAEFETVLREGARRIADLHGVDFKEVRKVLIDHFRAHRKVRAKLIRETAVEAELSEVENKENI